MDTTNILFVCGGAFVGLERIIQRRQGNQVMGFGAVEHLRQKGFPPRDEVLQMVEPEDLLAYGFIPEFVGRLPMVTTLAELTEAQLVQVLVEPKNALTKQYQKLLAMEGANLEFTDCALHALAREAIKKGTGARALRSLIEKLMLDVMFEAASALGTVGLTTGVTPTLTSVGKVIIIIAMLIGRLGPLTLLAALTFNVKPAQYNYPDESIIVG